MAQTKPRNPARRGRLTIQATPDSEGDLLCVKVEGVVNPDDYMAGFYEPFLAIVKKYGHYRLLVHYTPEFEGWEAGAADMSLKSIIEYGPLARRIAYVNPPERKMLQVRLQRPIMGGEIRNFAEGQYGEALAWIRSDP